VTRLALFDLDHTLLSGDSDVLWCDFLIAEGLLDRATFEARNHAMAERYERGAATGAEFCGFYAETLRGARPDSWQHLRERFLLAVIAPRLGAAARALVEQHRAAGDRLVLTTASNRFITELTAHELGIEVLIATELELIDGTFTGRTEGMLNMREGKLDRLKGWLHEQALDERALASATFYSDSANDLPLLEAVGLPVVVDPNEAFERVVRARGWPVLRLGG